MDDTSVLKRKMLLYGGVRDLDNLSVLDKDNDPFRKGTPGGLRYSRWLVDAMERVGFGRDRQIHLRGLHYLLSGRVQKPLDVNGSHCKYANRELYGGKGDFAWLMGTAASTR